MPYTCAHIYAQETDLNQRMVNLQPDVPDTKEFPTKLAMSGETYRVAVEDFCDQREGCAGYVCWVGNEHGIVDAAANQACSQAQPRVIVCCRVDCRSGHIRCATTVVMTDSSACDWLHSDFLYHDCSHVHAHICTHVLTLRLSVHTSIHKFMLQGNFQLCSELGDESDLAKDSKSKNTAPMSYLWKKMPCEQHTAPDNDERELIDKLRPLENEFAAVAQRVSKITMTSKPTRSPTLNPTEVTDPPTPTPPTPCACTMPSPCQVVAQVMSPPCQLPAPCACPINPPPQPAGSPPRLVAGSPPRLVVSFKSSEEERHPRGQATSNSSSRAMPPRERTAMAATVRQELLPLDPPQPQVQVAASKMPRSISPPSLEGWDDTAARAMRLASKLGIGSSKGEGGDKRAPVPQKASRKASQQRQEGLIGTLVDSPTTSPMTSSR